MSIIAAAVKSTLCENKLQHYFQGVASYVIYRGAASYVSSSITSTVYALKA